MSVIDTSGGHGGLARPARGLARSAALLATASSLALLGLANPALAASAEPDTLSEIVITGSRVIRDGSAAPTPVTTLTQQSLTQTAPSNIPDALNRLPQFLNSANQYRSATFNATQGLQGNYLNLRGLGPQRVLVLLDGARVPPTHTSNAVDSNIIPQMLVERVDVITGGASAVYGSDAVSGVVNYVLNKNFDGISVVAQQSLSDRGDAPSTRLGVAAGGGFDEDRGHALFSMEYYRNAGLPRQDKRPLYADLPLIVGPGTAATPFTQVRGARYNDVTFGGLIRSGPLAGFKFAPDGSVSPFVSGTPTTTSNIVVGGEGAYIPPTVLVPRLETQQAFARLSYDLSDSLNVFAQTTYARSETGYLSAYAVRRGGTGNGITIFADNPYLTPAVRAALGTTPSFTMSRLFSDAPGNEQKSVTRTLNTQLGVAGQIKGFNWDLTYVRGRSTLDLSQVEQQNQRFFAAIDAVRDSTGKIVCGVTLRNPALLQGCLPLNVIGLGNLDPAAIDWIRQASRSRIDNAMDIGALNITGDLFELPAGPLSVAFGGEVRGQKLNQTSNANPSITSDFTGIRGVPAGALTFSTTNVGVAKGSQSVKEVYGEVVVPLLRDVPMAERLEATGAVRYTHYRTSGSVTTWKLGAVYAATPDVRFRGTLSQDIAAPSLFDLFAGAQAALAAQPDVHTGITATLTQITAGNPNLDPEKGKTLVGGMVFTPRAIPGFTLSVDAYRIKIRDALQVTNSLLELNECEASGGTAPVCDLITRPLPFSDRTPANFPSRVIVAPQNLAILKTEGVDIEASYRFPLSRLFSGLDGDVDLRGFVSHTATYDTQDRASVPVVHRAGRVATLATTAGIPKWRGSLQQGYSRGGLTIRVSERFTGSYKRSASEPMDPALLNAPENRIYTDLYVSHSVGLGASSEVFLQVDNLFDVDPPELVATINPGFTYPTDKTKYDIVGRNFTVGVRLRF